MVDRSELIERHESRTALKTAPDAPRVRLTARCHGRNDRSAKMSVELVGRYNDAGAGLLDLAAERRVQSHQVHVAAGHHHFQSVRSNRVGVLTSSKASSPRSRMVRAAVAQPSRARFAALTTSRPGSARSSTSSGRSARSSRSFGTRMPREFPMRTILVVATMCLQCSHVPCIWQGVRSAGNLPPTFRTARVSCLPPRWRRFRRFPSAASSAEAWNGGLHIERSNTSPGVTTPAKHSRGDDCNRHSIRSVTAGWAATSLLAQRKATASGFV